MASNDKTAILTDDETDQRWNGSLAETVNSWPTEEVPNLSSSGPTPESPPTDAATSTSQFREPTTGCLQSVFSRINRDLLISKIFYFFFYAAYGSLHPLLPVYFKQLGLMASESGLLVGIRYFIEFCSAPFWGVVADRFRKGKAVLLFSVLCWLIFNYSISFVKPADMSCVQQNSTVAPQNSTQLNRSSIHSRNRRYLVGDLFASSRVFHGMDSVYKVQHRYERSASNFTALTTMSVTSSNTTTTAPNTTSTTASQNNYQIVYNKEQVQSIFLTILLVIIFGEFFSAPAVTIVDTVTLQYLGQNRDRYGLQRMWGSLGWGLAMLAVGIWIDNTYFQPFVQGTGCDQTEQQNYQIAFIVFGVLMGVALLVATQFYFDSHNDQRASQVLNITETQVPGRPPAELSDGDPPSEDTFPPEGSRQEFRFSELLRVLCSVRNSTVLFVAWFMGFGYGFVFSFLYWYLQSLNGTTTLFGICSVLNHISELIAYFTSHKLIELVGHIRVLYIGLACNTARYLYISYLDNAWIVLPMEVLQGMTHASVWAACISYLSATVPSSLRTSAQGILQGLHLGLGRGCGAMLGGVFITYFGEAATFRGLGMASLVTLLIFYLIQCLAGQSERQDKMQAENIPVPSSPISIATIDLDRHHSELQRPQPECRQQPMKRKHQEDANKPAWAFSGPPWVAVAFALCQIQEAMKAARRKTLADAQAPQGTNESSSPMGPAETSHTHATEQPSTLEDPSSPTKRPSKKCVEFTGTHGHQEQPSILPPTDPTKSVENQTPLPGNFEKPPHLSSNNPFYQ